MRGPIQNFRGHLVTAAVALTIAAVFLAALSIGAGMLRPVQDHYRIQALVPTAATLGKGSSVRSAGLRIGTVTGLERRGVAALVEVELDDDHAPIPVDSRVGVRLKTLIGENYLELRPGRSSRRLEDGGILPMRAADDYVELDTILSSLRGRTREHARELLQSLGGALRGRGHELNQVVEHGAGVVEKSAPITQVLAARRLQVSRLVDKFGAVARTVADRGTALRTLAHRARSTFEAIGARDVALRATLDELPSTLTQVRSTSGTLRTATRRASPVLTDVARVVRDLRPAARRLRPAAQEGRKVLRELDLTAPPLEGTLSRLRTLAGPLSHALPQLRRVLCQLNPAIEYIAPYARDIAAMIVGLGSANNYYDATGHSGRVFALVSDNSLVGYPSSLNKAIDTVTSAGLVKRIRDLGYNAYPAPDTAGSNKMGLDASGPSESKVAYPRIHAEC